MIDAEADWLMHVWLTREEGCSKPFGQRHGGGGLIERKRTPLLLAIPLAWFHILSTGRTTQQCRHDPNPGPHP